MHAAGGLGEQYLQMTTPGGLRLRRHPRGLRGPGGGEAGRWQKNKRAPCGLGGKLAAVVWGLGRA